MTIGTRMCPIGNTILSSPLAAPCSSFETDNDNIVMFPALAKPIPKPFNINPRYSPGIEEACERDKKPKKTISKPHLIRLIDLIL